MLYTPMQIPLTMAQDFPVLNSTAGPLGSPGHTGLESDPAGT